ncbi:hypothetical protein BDZ91DRAFT_852498, partial [Kalaharituber pfeilii]
MSSAAASASTSAYRPLINSDQKGQLMLDQAIKGFTQLLTPQQKATIQNGPAPQREQIHELTTEIADKIFLKFQAKKYVRRVQEFLEILQRYCPIIDTFVSSEPKIAALVWGGVKLLMF